MEFYEDYYHSGGDAVHGLELAEGDDVQFVTGDPEMDDLEKRLASDDITAEEVQKIMSGWIGQEPEVEGAPEDIGEGFDDTNPRS